MQRSTIKTQIVVATLVALFLIWLASFYELVHTRDSEVDSASKRAKMTSEICAEYTRTLIRRIDEAAIDMGSRWHGDWQAFSDIVRERQRILSDITFQVAVIDPSGHMVFSSLSKPNTKVDLSQREHFRVHADNIGVDELFISKPIQGKVSGKWSIQFTRPIYSEGVFKGVTVLSVSPELLATAAAKLKVDDGVTLEVARNSGELISRHPFDINFLDKNVFNFSNLSERNNDYDSFIVTNGEKNDQKTVYGYYKISPYGLIFLAGIPLEKGLSAYYDHKKNVIFIAATVSILVAILSLVLLRSMISFEKIQRQLEISKDLAEAANYEKSRFLAVMSHEIRTPLNGIVGLVEILLSANTRDEQKHFGKMLNNSVHSLMVIVNDILDFSKIEAGKFEINLSPFCLLEVVNSVADIYALRAKDKNVNFAHHVDSEVPLYLLGDADRLTQVLNNLLGNAIKFTENGYVVLTIKGHKSADDLWLLTFEVADTGVGVPLAQQDKLFQRFSQADVSTTRRFGGTGLGLAISKELVTLLGGEIGYRSQESGSGSIFWFSIPFSEVSAPCAQENPTLSSDKASGSITLSDFDDRVSILLVEDNDTNLIVAREILRKLGLKNIFEARNGEEAISCFQRQRFDLVLMDCQMPVLDGYEATKRLRAMGCNTPIIALTANAVNGDRDICLQAGMNDYCTKPVSTSGLANVLSQWLPKVDLASGKGVMSDSSPSQTPENSTAKVEPDMIVDVQGVLARLEGDVELFNMLLVAAAQSLPATYDSLVEALNQERITDAARDAHSIKGAALSVGALRVAEQARSVEMSCKANDEASARSLLPELLNELKLLQAFKL